MSVGFFNFQHAMMKIEKLKLETHKEKVIRRLTVHLLLTPQNLEKIKKKLLKHNISLGQIIIVDTINKAALNFNGSRDVLNDLVKNYEQINSRSCGYLDTALIRLLKKYKGEESLLLEMVKTLVDKGENIYAVNQQGLTPLLIAIRKKYITVIEYLVKKYEMMD